MTELILFARIIYLWKSSLSTAAKYYHNQVYRFILAADLWVFLILGLAIAMSIPAFNVLMHGTHIVVAHTMGATIGINSMLLFAFIFNITSEYKSYQPSKKQIRIGYNLLQISLLVFVTSLIIAGILKANWQFEETTTAYSTMMQQLKPWFILFTIAGIGVMTGFYILIIYVFKNLLFSLKTSNT